MAGLAGGDVVIGLRAGRAADDRHRRLRFAAAICTRTGYCTRTVRRELHYLYDSNFIREYFVRITYRHDKVEDEGNFIGGEQYSTSS